MLLSPCEKEEDAVALRFTSSFGEEVTYSASFGRGICVRVSAASVLFVL